MWIHMKIYKMKKIIDKLFLIKEIRSKEGVLHFKRYRLLSTPWFNFYIHKIYKADRDLHLHDHPWNYFNIIIKGAYIEQTIENGVIKNNSMLCLCTSRRKATQCHKIAHMVTPCVTTLFITGKTFRMWGYNVDGNWIDNETYRKLKNDKKL